MSHARYSSALELGLSINWRYHFVPAATKATSTPGLVYLDVGGALEPGVIGAPDARQGGPSAAELLMSHREFVYNHVFGVLPGHPLPAPGAPVRTLRVTLVLRQMPDIDGVVAAWLARRLIEDGDFPPVAESLGLWATEIVQGRLKCLPEGAALRSPHLGYLAAMAVRSESRGASDSAGLLYDGFALLDSLSDALGTIWKRDEWIVKGEGDPAARWWGEPALRAARERLERESELWKEDSAEGSIISAKLPDRDGDRTDTIEVTCFVLKKASVSTLNKYWVRAKYGPYFICSYDRLLNGDPGLRVIVSLDPSCRDGDRRPDLRGLGIALEEAECKKRRDGGRPDDRGSVPRWDDGSCDNADPWYDGRAHEFTIVESPYSGTRLEFEDVIGIATRQGFWEMPLVTGSVWLVEPSRPDLLQANDLLLQQSCETHFGDHFSAIESPAGIPRSQGATVEVVSAPILGGDLPTHVRRVSYDAPITLERAVEQIRPATRDSETGQGQRGFRHAALALRQSRWHPQRVEGLLRRHLNSGAQGQVIHGDGEVFYVDELTLVWCRVADKVNEASRFYGETFLYLVYVRQTLKTLMDGFDQELGRDVNDSGEVESVLRDGDRLLRAANRFLSRWLGHLRGASELEVSVRASLSDSMQIDLKVAEVRRRSDMLALRLLRAGEVRQAALKEKEDEHAGQRDRWLNRVLYLMAVAGVFQTYIAWAQWGGVPARHDAGMALVIVLAIVVLVVIEWRFHEARRRFNSDAPQPGEKRDKSHDGNAV